MKKNCLAMLAATVLATACGGGGGGGNGLAGLPPLLPNGTLPIEQPGDTPPGQTQPGGTQPGGTQPGGTPPGSEPGGTNPQPAVAQYEAQPSGWSGDREEYLASRDALLNLLNEQGAKGAVRLGRLSDPQKSLFVNPLVIDDKYSFKEFTLTFSGRDGWDQASAALLQRLEDEGAQGYVLHSLLGETQTLDDSLNAIRKASFILVRNDTRPATYTYRKFNFNQMRPADFIAQANAWGQESYRFLNATIGLSPNWDVLAVKSSSAAGATYTYAFEPVVSDPKPQLISRGETGYRYKGYFEYQANPNNQPIQGVFNFYEFDSSRPAAVTYRFSDDTTNFPNGRPDVNTPEGLAVVNEQARQGFFFTSMSIPTSANGGVATAFAAFGIYVQGGMLVSKIHTGGDAGGAILFP